MNLKIYKLIQLTNLRMFIELGEQLYFHIASISKSEIKKQH